MSDSEDATDARRNELFEEPQNHANVPASINASVPAPISPNIPAPVNTPNPSSSENDTNDSNLDVPSSPSELSEDEFLNWYYKGPSGRGWAREKTPWRPRREKPSAKKAAGETTGGQGDTGSNGAGPSHGSSSQAAPAAPEHHHQPNPQTGGDNAVQQPDRPTQEELPADPLTRTTGPGDYDWGPAPAFAFDEPDMDAQTQAELFALFNNGAFERPAVPEDPLEGSSASAAANTASPPSFPEVVAAAQDQQQEPDNGNDEDAEHDEFDYLFEEEETSTAADASTVAGTPANDFQTPGTEYSDADSNFK
ncbi:hypothetical protein DBV05_g6704 [Lasiodiplodia theobromae]|uniref:Uncharacterized protein n=1 Tax=Lasiodiplodia theobromae TaxID=45133 RepID=A0A5N5DA82_9PEZI|nr:hypothetical protein DBV05_g6704 [Lasiodiplodia theobromae]